MKNDGKGILTTSIYSANICASTPESWLPQQMKSFA